MTGAIEQTNESTLEPDYTYVNSTARIAVYDDLKSAPRITVIQPDETSRYIENLSVTIYEQAQRQGGSIPYTVIREVSENFIHAQFKEIVVSILDKGNTIRFTDQGPGISDTDKARQPGFTSAVEPMKHYIRGVGSGLPIVCDYLNVSHGSITFDDNLGNGAVVTISMVNYSQPGTPAPDPVHDQPTYRLPSDASAPRQSHPLVPPLTQREQILLALLFSEGICGVSDLAHISELPVSSTHVTLKKLQEAGLVERTEARKWKLSDFGTQVAGSL